MPHIARQRSESGYYHVVCKGMADQLIFENDLDREAFLRYLAEAKAEYAMRLHAYCLMSNHVHLVVEDVEDRLSEAIKYVLERYAMRLAKTTGRKGRVFSRPFWSEPIESDAYLLCAVRYVHANPRAAGICPAAAYHWSSARQYLGRCGGIADTDMVLDMLGGREEFIQFSQQANATLTPFPGSRLAKHLSDEEALVIAQDVIGTNVQTVKSLQREARTEIVRRLHQRGFTVTLIMRLTGLGRREIEQAL